MFIPSMNTICFDLFPVLTAKYTDYKPSWPLEPIGHNKPWKTNRNSSYLPRPPPGLTHQKQPSVSPWTGGGPRFGRGWGGSGGGQENRYGPGNTTTSKTQNCKITNVKIRDVHFGYFS